MPPHCTLLYIHPCPLASVPNFSLLKRHTLHAMHHNPFSIHADIGKRTLLCVCVCLLQHAEIHVFDAPHVPHEQRPTVKLLWGDTRVCNGDERTCKARSVPLARAFPSRSCICVERVNGTCTHEGGARDRWGEIKRWVECFFLWVA
jgi:hypothetical protein